MCISNMIHLWWIKPAVSIERWPRTPCTRGNRRRKRPLSPDLPNIAWPSTDHCAALSTEVTIGQIWSHNNPITLYFFREIIRKSSNATGNQVTVNKISYSGIFIQIGTCVLCAQCEIMMTLSYLMPSKKISYDIISTFNTLLNMFTVLQRYMYNMPLKCITDIL